MNFSRDQLEAVRRVLESPKDLYEVLGVSKDATDSEIKSAYRKLALQLHPDKNPAPRAAEAFKAVSTAYVLLNTPEGRKKYDYERSLNNPDESEIEDLLRRFGESKEAELILMGIAAGVGIVGGYLLLKGLFGGKKRSDSDDE